MQFRLTNGSQVLYSSVVSDTSFGGPLTVASVSTSEGKVKQVHLFSHGDTPAYIQKLKNAGYFRRFEKQNIDATLTSNPDWDSVSGATISSTAILRAHTKASHVIAINQFQSSPEPMQQQINVNWLHLALISLISLSFINIWLKNSKLKLAYTFASVVVLGFTANQMINIGDFAGILMGYIPALHENLSFWILFGLVLLAIIVVGRNIYCGNICPFHGIQLLLQKISGIDLPIPPRLLFYLRYFPKFGLWAALMISFITTKPSAGSYEPFSMIFSLQGEGIQWYILPATVIGCFFIPDMFCRFLCPAGEMLTLLTRLRNKVVYPFQARKKYGQTITVKEVQS
ncbi:4Fe-4S binding protein [Vibrio sp. HN007]|uniref:FMN-binding protein n=1 Tax=Vibrio iocasae TaxID=3098914 RepID=UPI0035D4D825